MKKRIAIVLSIVLMFTMLFSTGSVFAYGGHPPLGAVKRIEPSSTYVQVKANDQAYVSVIAIHERGAIYVNRACTWSVDHNNIITVDQGIIKATQKGVATITVKYLDTQAQITVEVV